MKARSRILTTVVGAVALASALAPAVYAEDPPALDAGYVTDHADILSDSQEQTLEADLKNSAASGVEVFVVYVNDFSNPTDAEEWARATGDRNNLGPRQMLLAIATDGRAFYLAEHVDTPFTATQITDIENDVTLPYLRNDDWAGAAKATGEAVAQAYTSQSGSGTGSSGSSIVPVLIGGAVIVGGGGLAIYGITRSRKNAKAKEVDSSDPYAGMTDEELSKRAGSALVSADDSITSSKEELSFAAAQFGQGAVDKFQGVVDEAEANVQAAFRLQQQLDDDIPDTREQQRAWWIEIIDLCEQAEALIDSNAEAFDALRELEKNAPQALATVETQLGELEQGATAVVPELTSLAQAYAPAVLETVRENPDHIKERIALVKNQVAEAKKYLEANQTGEAAFAIRTAEEGVFQGRQLVEAVTKLRNDLASADAESRALMADIQGDIASTSTISGTDLAPIVQATQGELARAATALDGPSRNPLSALEALTAANARIDTAIAEARTKAEREARAQQMLQSTMTNARAQIGAATDFINTRRGRVGSTARTRLAEASAAYNQATALYPTSAEEALGHANRALQLANEAIQHANNDVNYSGGGWGGGGGGNLSGDILGGIIGGIISGGGGGRSSGGYRGGGSWGGSSGGGFRTSGFGGGGGFRGGGGFSGGSRGGGGRF